VHARGHTYIALGLNLCHFRHRANVFHADVRIVKLSPPLPRAFAQRTQADFLTDFGNSITRPRCSEGTHFTFLGKGSGT